MDSNRNFDTTTPATFIIVPHQINFSTTSHSQPLTPVSHSLRRDLRTPSTHEAMKPKLDLTYISNPVRSTPCRSHSLVFVSPQSELQALQKRTGPQRKTHIKQSSRGTIPVQQHAAYSRNVQTVVMCPRRTARGSAHTEEIKAVRMYVCIRY